MKLPLPGVVSRRRLMAAMITSREVPGKAALIASKTRRGALVYQSL